MMTTISYCFMIMIAVYRMAGVCGKSSIYPGQFSEHDLSEMGTLHSMYCDRDVNCNEAAYYQQNNRQVVNKSGICCKSCSCDLSTCINLMECCPELLNEIEFSFDTGSCVHPQWKPWKPETQRPKRAVVMISHCPKDLENPSEYIDKCENSLKYTAIDSLIPVSVGDFSRVVTYKNRYCAYCNSIDDTYIQYWSTKFECRSSVLDVTVTSFKQIVEEAHNSEDCIIYFQRPTRMKDYHIQLCGVYISECNITGKWKRYDPLIEAACMMAYDSAFQFTYKNVFCYLCNIGDDDIDNLECSIVPYIDLPFSMVLKYIPTEIAGSKSIPTPNFQSCGDGEIYDSVQEKCLAVKCLMSKVYIAGECQQVVEEIKGVNFNVFLKMTPFERLENTDDVESEIVSFTKNLLDEPQLLNTEHQVTMYYMHKQTLNTSYWLETLYFVVYFELHSEKDSIDTSSIDSLLEMHERNISISPDCNDSITLFLELDTSASVNTTSLSNNNPTLLPVLFCPLVELNASFYHFEYSLNSVTIKEFDTDIERNAYIKTDASNIAICESTFMLLRDRLNQIRKHYSDTITVLGKTPVGILSLVCSSVSIWCSCITLIVYLRVKSLHTQPGVNTMCLIVSLIFAQTFFQFGIGQAQNIPTWTCSLIGGLVHYFWIVTILWMNVCTYYMFQLFRKFQNVDFSRSLRRTTCLYWLYCSMVALLPVLTNIIVMYSKYGSTGYGGNLCYISDNKMVGFCFVLPVSAVVVANWLMLVYTIYMICTQIAVKKLRQEEKKYLLIYAKMSTLTGLTWIFGFLFFFINFAVLEYLFVIFNAGQGVFLFLSFVCNKRTWKLLMKLNERELTSPTLIRSRR